MRSFYRCRGWFNWIVIALIVIIGGCRVEASTILPDKAYLYRPLLLKLAYSEFGHAKYVAAFGAQIHQESLWDCEARSKYAIGCAQFTPSTAKWMQETIGREFGPARPQDPVWALPAMVRYMKWLRQKVTDTASECDRYAMTLSAYNGGLGWVHRDRKLAKKRGYNYRKWWYNVENTSARADWAFNENRGYPRRILLVLNKKYLSGGDLEIICEL